MGVDKNFESILSQTSSIGGGGAAVYGAGGQISLVIVGML